MSYHCRCCHYYTNRKSSYQKHVESSKHIENYRNNSTAIVTYENDHDEVENLTKYYHSCKYCGKLYKYSQGLSKHIKYSCKYNKDESFQELANLLNSKEKLIAESEKYITKLEKQIKQLTDKLQIKNVNGGNYYEGHINNTMNINVLNYNNTDYDFLTDKDYIKCIEDCNHCVKTLIEKIHFNKKKPENMNIYISSIKGKYIMVYRDNKWQIKNRKDQIDDLYECNEFMLENWYDHYHCKYPHIIQSFKRYLKNKDEDDDLIRRVKDEILLMLYNKRDMITTYSDNIR